MLRGLLPLLALLPAGGAIAAAPDGDLHAYYTRVRSSEAFERRSRTGEYADIVVRVRRAGGRLVFWRGTSYLPRWETDAGRWALQEIVPRSGDGRDRMPDRVNTYSRVAIVESGPDRVRILWRYCREFRGGNPHTGVSASSFVEELFDVFADGRVVRTIREGTEKLAAWDDPLHRRTQEVRLGPTGIESGEVTVARRSPPSPPIAGAPLRRETVGRPVLHFRFDEGSGDTTTESRSGHAASVPGPRAWWRAGVSGTALEFDGYTTVVRLPADRAPSIDATLTLEAWLAIGAYPWNRVPIVQQGDDDGYFLGLDGKGHPQVGARMGERWELLTSETRLERGRWYHVVGTVDGGSGRLRLYIDGVPAAERRVPAGPIRTTGDDVQIGQGKPRRPVDPVRRNTFVDTYSFDGLIDEIKVHDRVLSPEGVREAHRSLVPPGDRRDRPDMGRRRLPSPPRTGAFGARYTRLAFHDAWDGLGRFGDYPDVVVDFDRAPTRFIFWRGTGYIPMLVNEKEQWYSNEFNETWGTSGGRGCQEPMSDKEGYTNHARIVESSPARVVVHWRYPLIDVLRVTANYDETTGWGDWSDWYFTIYPDGVAVKRMRLWTHGRRNHEWQESMAIFGPDQHPESIIERKRTLTMIDLDGDHVDYDWEKGPPPDVRRPSEKRIQLVNYTGEHDPFTIGEFRGSDVYGGELTPYAVFPTWNHWPVAQMPSDGRYASFPDRTAHSSLTHVRLPVHAQAFGDRPFEERLIMEGMTREGREWLVALARSWLRAPPLEVQAGATGGRYDRAQRAYVLAARADRIELEVLASTEQPVLNPAFVVRNWGTSGPARVEISGQAAAPGPSVRQGVVRDTRGRRTLILWLDRRCAEPLEISIAGASPRADTGLSPSPLGWSEEPRAAGAGALSIRMSAAPPRDVPDIEYSFECIGDPARSSGWQESPEWVATGLAPETTYSFRVRARETYLWSETEWSRVATAATGEAPDALARWPLDEGRGQRVRDATGRAHGELRGARWVEGPDGQALAFSGDGAVVAREAEDLTTSRDFTWEATVRAGGGGTILAYAPRTGEWAPGGMTLFLRGGRLTFDIGWVGNVASPRRIDDGAWHHVAVTLRFREGSEQIRLWVDGRPAGGSDRLSIPARRTGGDLTVKLGFTSEDFPTPSGLTGEIANASWFGYALGEKAIADLAAKVTSSRR